MDSNRQRTLIIGLDGATFDLIDPLMRAGDLPNMARLIERGVRAPLQTWPNTNSAAAWSSMITGYNSGHHGIFHFSEALNRSDGVTGWSPVTATDRKKDPFWRILSAAGQHVGVINVPISYPADAINGFMLAGMDAPSTQSPGFAHPAGLLDELRRQDIDYIIDVPDLGVASRRDPHRLPDSVRHMIDARSRTILYFMQNSPWDVLMAVFVATDRVQHYFWPQRLSAVEAPDWAPIRSLYRQIDDFFGKALALAGEETTVLVVSDHGFGPLKTARRCLNKLFVELGLLSPRQRRGSLKSRLLKNLLLSGRKILPFSFQRRLARALPGLHLRAVSEHNYSSFDWSRTQAYAAPQGSRVWINLQGRSPEGAVPASMYEPLREQIREILSNITDPATGRRAIREVRRREEIYRGPYLEKAADLLVEWESDAIEDSLGYSADGRSIIVKADEKDRTNKWKGNHRPLGILIASGPHIKHGERLAQASIYDIAPT
ncbi:MAG TPA: alkaline phosphatase family protein, partial [Blastocatellia bacterium]|nr:alkaline phosphatase family protein [Blastocatellia bacterium]